MFTTIVHVNYTVMDVTPNPYSLANQGIFDITKGANKKSCTEFSSKNFFPPVWGTFQNRLVNIKYCTR
jgi:hypothetical protein